MLEGGFVFPPISTLLPQKEGALLLDAVVEHGTERTVCSASVSATHPYLDVDRVDAVLSLELLAQAAAARAALESQGRGEPRKGYVVAVPWLEFEGGAFTVGDELRVSVQPTHVGDALVKYSGEVSVWGELRARGELSVLLAKVSP